MRDTRLLNCVPLCRRGLRANVLACQRGLRANVSEACQFFKLTCRKAYQAILISL